MIPHSQHSTTEVRLCQRCDAPLPPSPSGTRFFNFAILYCADCSADRADAALEETVARKVATWQRHRQHWLDASGLPATATVQTFAAFDRDRSPAALTGHRAAAGWVRRYLSHDSHGPAPLPWLVLHSQANGTGKTHLLYAMLCAVLDSNVPSEMDIRKQEHAAQDAAPEDFRETMTGQRQRQRYGCPVLVYNAWELSLAVNEARRPKAFDGPQGESEQALMQRLVTVPVLGIDDWGRVRSERDMREQHHIWYAIVDGREKRGLPILATSNVRREGLVSIIGNAASDRLVGHAVFVPMEGESQRSPRGSGPQAAS
jgi:hypothetical protein